MMHVRHSKKIQFFSIMGKPGWLRQSQSPFSLNSLVDPTDGTVPGGESNDQGSHKPWKSLKVLEFFCCHFKPWKVLKYSRNP